MQTAAKVQMIFQFHLHSHPALVIDRPSDTGSTVYTQLEMFSQLPQLNTRSGACRSLVGCPLNMCGTTVLAGTIWVQPRKRPPPVALATSDTQAGDEEV